jgi:hypothetical protein
MRYRDQPTVEVTQRVTCDVPTAWKMVTDIGLPARCSPELQSVEWLGGADGVEVGARFRGRNLHAAFGEWETECEVVEVEDGRRWVWNAIGPDGPTATYAIEARPELEARIVAKRLAEWQQNMQVNLDCMRDQVAR